MTVSPPSDLPTPASSSRILNVTWKVHHKANSSSTTNVNLLEIDHYDGSEKGYLSDPGFISNLVRKARRLGRSISKSKKAPYAMPSESLADVPAPVITIDTPESTGTTIARESDTLQLQPEGGIHPPQPPISYPADSRDIDQTSPLVASTLRHDIFLADALKPTVRATIPEDPQAGIVSTLQLVHCARLLLEGHHPSTSQSSPTGVGIFDDAVSHWLEAIQEDPSAQARIRWLLSRLVKEFRSDLSPEPEAIFEVVVLGPVLCEVDYRDLLSCFIERFDQSALLNPCLLQGMIQLLQSAPSGFLNDDDLVRTMSSLRKRLESTHAPDRTHVYQLVFAVSKVLEVMVRGDVKGLNRQRDHQSLLAALRNLQDVENDEFLKFQISYAYQMSLYLPDDETSFQAFWRYAESISVGVSAVASVFKLDPMSALAAVEHIQQVAGNAIDVVKFNIDGAQAFQATAEGAGQAAEKAYWSQKKQPWFLALQAGYLFVQDGRLVDFNVLVCNATRRYDVNFQRGVCLILGEIALNPLWDDGSRRNAIDFLGEFWKTDAGRRKDVKVKRWVATTLQQISSSASPDVSGHARTLLDHLQQEHAFDIKGCRALHSILPIPTVFPLLERALCVTDIDQELACIQFHSHDKRLYPAFIPLRAKATLQAPKDQSFPLMVKVQEFLQSNKLVFLLLGDSGSGKSMFCEKLELELWNQHQRSDGGRIPLYIYLPSIEDPHSDLIGKYLRLHHNISEKTIRNIKNHRQFVLICDGYDESRVIQNLYTTNRLNRPGQWNVKMIITCRSTFLGPDYQTRFYPLDDNKYHDNSSRLFEEATIVPFQKSEIQEFVMQYVLEAAAQEPSDNPSVPSFDDYWEKLSVIPNVMNLVSNPFLLTLALRAIPSKSIEALDSKGLEVMQKDLYDGFMQEWTRLQKIRLQGTILKQDNRAAAFEILLTEGFSRCVIDYLKRLADAIYQYQDGRPVVKFSRRHMEDWKVEFFGPEIETTLLRDASPLTRAGIRHWFIHKSLLDYFYALSFHDPDDSDDDDSDDSEDGDDDSRGGGDDFHNGGGNFLGDGGDGLVDDNGASAGGNEGSTGGNAQSTDNNGGSSGGNGSSSGGNGGSTSENQDSSGGIGNSSGGSSGNSSGDNNNGSRGDKNGSNGDEDGSRRRKDDARSKRKGNATKSRPSTSSDPFSKRNLFKEPSVLQFLVERAESDPRLKKRLFLAIEQSKVSSVPSMAAANAITILFKSKNLFENAVLDGVLIPGDYMSMATGSTEPVQLPESDLTGGDLMKMLVTLTSSESESTVPETTLTIPVLPPTGPIPTPHTTTIAQMAPAATLKPSRSDEKNIPLPMPRYDHPLDQLDPHTTDTVRTRKRDKFHKLWGFSKSKTKQADLNSSIQSPHSRPLSQQSIRPSPVLSQASNLPSGDNQSTTSRTMQGKALARVFEMIFPEDVPRPTVKTELPQIYQRIETTQQLVYCNALFLRNASSPLKSVTGEAAEEDSLFILQEPALDKTELDWLEATKKDPMETDRLRRLATRMVEQFIADASKDSNKIAEIVTLGPILEKEPYRKLLATFIKEFDDARVLDVDIIQGLIQLVQDVSPGYLVVDDLVELFGILRVRLEGTHQQSTEQSYLLTLAVSRILDVMGVMADHKVQDLVRVLEHEPLSAVLSGLKDSSDPYMMYQACYAFQALQYVLDKESALQAVLRLSNAVVDSLFKVTTVLKLDMASVLEGLGTLQEAIEGAISVDGNALEGVLSLMESGRGALDSLKEGLESGRKEPWYPAVRAAYAFVQAGQLKDLKQLIFEAPCRRDPLFQWGICQLLGEIAVDTVWDVSARQQSIFLLGHLRQHDLDWGQDESVKAWMLTIITKLCTFSDQAVSETARSVVQDLIVDQSSWIKHPYPLRARLPLPSASPLLVKVQNIQYLEYALHKFRLQRLEEVKLPVYISPMAKANLQARDDELFPLKEKVQEFLASERQVMLILGESGAGKSAFNTHLESELLQSYNRGGPVPLFINLPAIDRPDKDLIGEHLRINNFSEAQIQELKKYRQFVLICDGYDESQLTVNLHTTNLFNQPGHWNVKMVISCRTKFLGQDYRSRFIPDGTGHYTRQAIDLFQEAVIAPFSKEQIEDYVKQYVPLEPRTWTTEDYMDILTTIPNLIDLVKNPFLLSLSLESLPGVTKGKHDLSAIKITRIQLYDTFVRHWLALNSRRLQRNFLTREDRDALEQLLEAGFISMGVNYATKLASAIFEHQDGNPVVQYVHIKDKTTWRAEFFGPDSEARMLRESSPLTRTRNLYRFVHRSMLEYFFSLAVFDPSSHDVGDEFCSQPGLDPTPVQLLSTDGPLFKRNLLNEPSVIQFLCERVKQYPAFEKQLLAVIEQSKADATAATAAVNAITILVRAGVHFNGADLRGIRIPGADLSNGQFDTAQLQGADLMDVNFARSWLRQVDFGGAQMEGVRFEELPYLNESENVHSCAYSPDGTLLAVGLDDDINIYNTSTWTMTRTFQGHQGLITSIAYSPTSRQLLSGSHDNTVRLWDFGSGSCRFVLEGHTDWVWTVAFSPSGIQVASAGSDKTVRLWDVQTGVNLFILTGHTGFIPGISYSPNGYEIASADDDKMLRIFDTQTGETRAVWKSQYGSIRNVEYSPGGLEIAVVHDNGNPLLYNTTTGKLTKSCKAHRDTVLSSSFSPNIQWVATCSYDKEVKVWSTATGSIISVLTGHSEWVNQVAFSPNGLQLASCSRDRTIRLWDVSSLGTSMDVEGGFEPLRSVLFSPNGRVLFSSSSSGAVRQYDAVSGESGLAISCRDNLGSCLAISPDGLRIALVGTPLGRDDSVVTVWDLKEGEAAFYLYGHTEQVTALAFSADSRWIATSSEDKTVRLWKARSGKLKSVLEGHTDSVRALAFSSDSNRILSGSVDGTIRAWDLEGRECRVVVEKSGGNTPKWRGNTPKWTISSSSDGWRVASFSFMGRCDCVDFWDAESGQIQQTLKHNDTIICLAFSSCGQWVGVGWLRSVWLLNFVADNSVEGGRGGGEWRCSVRIRDTFGEVASIAWKPGTLEFSIGCENGSLQAWRLVETSSRNAWSARFVWRTGKPVLVSTDAVFTDALGLSPANQQLLTQCGKEAAKFYSYL